MEAKKSFVIFHLSFVLKSSFVLVLFSFFLLFSSCKRSTEPISNPQTLQLTVADVSCTEAWLRLKTETAEKTERDSSNSKLQLYRNDSLILNKSFTATDSVLYVDGLQPATTYSFSAKVLKNGKLQATGYRLPVTTMDTTSHNFTWQTFEFGGQGGSSSFYDVAIIDENDIWAVGEIYTENDKYNAAHWDGEKWELKKIDWDGYVSRLTCVFAFSKNDVWFGVTNLIHWNGTIFEKNINPVLNQFYSKTVNKIWGTSDHDLYVVGNNGLIAHYDGRQWTRIENDIKININDIFGTLNGKNVFCSGTYIDKPGSFLIAINDDQVNFAIDVTSKEFSILNYELSGFFESVCSFDNRSFYFLSSSGVYHCLPNGRILGKRLSFTDDYLPGYPTRIRGNERNDFFITGQKGMFAHFNGKTWKLFSEENTCTNLYSVDQKGNMAVAVGSSCKLWGEGFIKMGRR